MSVLSTWDYASMASIVGFTCAVGLYHVFRTGKTQQTNDFLVSNKELNVFPLIMSIVATIVSSGNLSGTTMEVYAHGIIYFLFPIACILATVLSAVLYVPVFYQLNKQTVYEYLEMRFCSKVRIGVSIMHSTQMLLIGSCHIYATALILSQVTSLSVWASVSVIGVTCIVYTSLGGFKAVVWTDAMQQVVIFATLLLLITKGLLDIGGLDVVWKNLSLGGRDRVFIWTPEKNYQYSFWTWSIGNVFNFLAFYATNQSLMQRCLSNKTLSRAKVVMVSGGLGFGVCVVLITLCGAIVSAKYYNCDPLIMGLVKTRDQILILFAVETLSFLNGLTGVFVAGLLCASISTLSSYLNSLAAITMSDYIKPLYPGLSAKRTLMLSKLITVVHGLICIGSVAVIQNLGGIMRILFSVASLIGGPTLVIFTVGMLLPWVNTKAALVGLSASIVLPWWATIGHLTSTTRPPHLPFSATGCSNYTDIVYDSSQIGLLQQFYTISPLWFACWSLVMGLTFSLIAGKIIGFQDPSKVNPDLVFPFVRRFIKYQPKTEDTKTQLQVYSVKLNNSIKNNQQ